MLSNVAVNRLGEMVFPYLTPLLMLLLVIRFVGRIYDYLLFPNVCMEQPTIGRKQRVALYNHLSLISTAPDADS